MQFVQATILGGIRQLLFIATDCLGDDGEPVLPEGFHSKDPLLTKLQKRLLRHLCEDIFDKAFAQELEEHLDLMYQNEAAMDSHFSAYKEYVLSHVADSAETWFERHKDQQEMEQVAKTVLSRVQYLFDHPDFSLQLMPWTPQSPIFSPLWYQAILHLWKSVSGGVNMVSELFALLRLSLTVRST